MKRSFAVVGLSGLVSLGVAGEAAAQVRVIPVPSHPLYGQLTPRAISGDGTTVVGYGRDGNRSIALAWTIDGAIDVIPTASVRTISTASAVSYDGSVVGGTTSGGGPDAQIGFRWVRGSSVALANGLSGQPRLFSVSEISGDGQWLVGDVFQSGPNRAAKWSIATGTIQLPTYSGAPTTRMAAAISGDGETVLGMLLGGAPFAWRSDTGSFAVPVPDGLPGAYRLSLTANGDAIFGMSTGPVPGTNAPFTWNPDTGSSPAFMLDGYDTVVESVSADGRVVVGTMRPLDRSTEFVAALSTLGTDPQPLGEYFVQFGSSHPNSDFESPLDVSDDGFTVLGSGGIYPYWVAIVPPPQLSDFNIDRFVDFQDVTSFYDCFEGKSSLPVSSADINHDGFTDFFDVMEFFEHF